MCENGNHFFIYSGSNSLDEISEEYPCECGMIIAKYEYCPRCGSKILKTILNPNFQYQEQFPKYEFYPIYDVPKTTDGRSHWYDTFKYSFRMI